MLEGKGTLRPYHTAGVLKVEDCTWSNVVADTLTFLIQADWAIDASIDDPNVSATYVLLKGGTV